jgi:type I restriction enzyme S subunit
MTGHLFRVRFDQSRCDPHFAFAALRGARSIRSQVFDQVRGATRPGFNTTLLSNVKLPVPPLPEQRRIVAYLDDLQAKVDQLKTLQAQTAAELDALLPSILDRAFRGEL